MINKCKVQDFLKLNWLLKIGFSNDAYKIIWKECKFLTNFSLLQRGNIMWPCYEKDEYSIACLSLCILHNLS